MIRNDHGIPLWTFAAVLTLVFLVSHGTDVGKGFVKEDAAWVMQSRVDTVHDLSRVVTRTGGFFRPVVALSFAINYWMFGGDPLGYGWTNLLLAAATGLGIYMLARSLGLPRGSALLAVALWILNFHGINMAVLWLSGRTALLLVLFAVLAAVATARNRLLLACVFALLAMGSKEEGVLLPIALLSILVLHPGVPATRRRVLTFGAGLVAVWVVYAAVRMQSDAMTPVNAPAFYTFAARGWSPLKNLAEYADRSLTFSLAVTIVAIAIAGSLPRLTRAELKMLALGMIWLICGFALTILLPARSSLYVVFPSVGGAIAAAVICTAVWRAMSPKRQARAALAALLVPVLLVPIHWRRNARWTELAIVSRDVVTVFTALADTAAPRWDVIVIDDRTARANIAAAIAIPDAVELAIGRRPHVWLIPPPDDMEAHDWTTPPSNPDAVLALRAGRIVRVPVTEWRPAPAAEWP
jgi:hypothetical protein